MMIANAKNIDSYDAVFDRFERHRSGSAPAWLQDARRSAFERFMNLGFPTSQDEEWRCTSVRPISSHDFELARPTSLDDLSIAVGEFTLGDTFHRRIFVNGHYVPQLASTQELPGGTVVGSLAEHLTSQSPHVQPELTRQAKTDNAPFTALNTAFIEDGAFVYVPPGVTIDKPIELAFVSTTNQHVSMSHPRNLFVLGKDSKATIIERYVSREGETYLTNVVTETAMDDGAQLDHHKLQEESRNGFHIATLNVHQGRSTRFCSHYFSVGAALARNEVNCFLDAQDAECRLYGLYVASGDQHMDSRTRIDHAKPNCQSFELYKGILDGRAQGVFNGKIYVHPDAQKTAAKQSNQVLLLSDDAVIDTKPQLEIYADDVKCTHGSTVGELDRQSLHYLRSRGIPADLARSMLIFAFANEVVQDVSVDEVRTYLESVLLRANDV